MPAIMDDPDSATIYRVSGEPPYPDPAHPSLPETIVPRQVTLRDRQTVATVVPFASRAQVPPSLLLYLSDQFTKEIEGGDTYPMIDPMPFEKFASYWFQNFGAIMLLGSIESPDEVVEGKDWSKECLGSFYIKPNYPGRSSHVCNAGFLVTDAARNRGAGRLMGETYLDWAPKLGYTYSVFNLVYETNVVSCKIWDALGFKRIGRVKGCGNLKSFPGQLIDAIIYGRDLALGESEELVSEERFDKIKFYLKYGKYPNGADRAEKSRLRSAATHYKLLDGDKLMLKDKEVISDPGRQYDIAREVHVGQHGGINKTTASIAERYHWSRIKETVSDVIRNCTECKELGKTPFPGNAVIKGRPAPGSSATGAGAGAVAGAGAAANLSPSPSVTASRGVSAAGRKVPLRQHPPQPQPQPEPRHQALPHFAVPSTTFVDHEPMTVMSPGHTLHTPTDSPIPQHSSLPGHNPMLHSQSHGLHAPHHGARSALSMPHPHSVYQPIDPQIISQPSSHAHHHAVHHHHHHHHHHDDDPFASFHHHPPTDSDADTFQALLNATDTVVDDGPDGHVHHHHGHDHDPHRAVAVDDVVVVDEDEADRAAMDRDLDMLIEPQDDDEEMDPDSGMDIEPGGVLSNDASRMDIGRLISSGGSVRGR